MRKARPILRLLLLTLVVPGSVLAQDDVVWSQREKPIFEQILGFPKLDDNARARATKALALEIQALPPTENKLQLAGGLTNFASQGDLERDALQAATTTLEAALREQVPKGTPGHPNPLYVELASLARYEHMQATSDDPQFAEAMSRLDSDDAARQKADFTLTDLEGRSWHLKELKGKVVLVNFWATWCVPCRKEMPDLQALYDKYKDQGFIVLSISDEEASKVKPCIAEERINYPILLDPGRKANRLFIVEGIPKNFVYDRKGKLVAQAIHMRTRNQFLAMLVQAGLK
jgi:thiol-disulfide isomerase/thioredoxin